MKKNRTLKTLLTVLLATILIAMLCACDLFGATTSGNTTTPKQDQEKETPSADQKDDDKKNDESNDESNDSLTESEIKTLLLEAETRLYATKTGKSTAVCTDTDGTFTDNAVACLEVAGSGDSFFAKWQNTYNTTDYQGYTRYYLGQSGGKYLHIRDEYDTRYTPPYHKYYSELTTAKYSEYIADWNFGRSVMCDAFGETMSEVTINDIFEMAKEKSSNTETYSGMKTTVDSKERYELSIEFESGNSPWTHGKYSFIIQDGFFTELKMEWSQENQENCFNVVTTIDYNYTGPITLPSLEGFTLRPDEDFWNDDAEDHEKTIDSDDSLTESEIKSLLLEAETRLSTTQNAKATILSRGTDEGKLVEGMQYVETVGSDDSQLFRFKAESEDYSYFSMVGKTGDAYVAIHDRYQNGEHTKRYSEITEAEFQQSSTLFGGYVISLVFVPCPSLSDLFDILDQGDAIYSGTKTTADSTIRYELAIDSPIEETETQD